MSDTTNNTFNAPMSPALEAAVIALKEAEIALRDAETAKTQEEQRRIVNEVKVGEIMVEQATMSLERERAMHTFKMAQDEHHLFYSFTNEVNEHTVGACIYQLTTWMRTRPGEPIEIQFNSPGGSMIDGMALWDFIQTLKAKGHHVTTSTIGYAASMAAILLQAGDHRVMGRESYALIHEISFGAGGKMGDVEDITAWVKMVQDRVLNIFAARSKLSKAQIKKQWSRRDWWLDSEQCLKFGLVDEIR